MKWFMDVVRSEALTKQFNSFTAVSNLNFTVDENEVFGLLGPNGAGKTTTIRMLATLLHPTQGTAQVAGYDILKDPVNVRRSVGILTENPSLYERLTAYENMEFYARAYGVTGEQKIRGRVKTLLEEFDLWDRRNDRVVVFSKGMKQKLAIARAIIHDPKVVLLDEPTASLDPEASRSIRDLIVQMTQHEEHTVLLSTHRLEDAEKLCHKVLIINKGMTRALETPQALRRMTQGKPRLEVRIGPLDGQQSQKLRGSKYVKSLEVQDGRLLIELEDDSTTPEVVRMLVEMNISIYSVTTILPSLEDAYLMLVKQS
jgi:ABC-2 type transport system ATP-binding protein